METPIHSPAPIPGDLKSKLAGCKTPAERVDLMVEHYTPAHLRTLPSNPQTRALFTTLRDSRTGHDDFVFYADRLARAVVLTAIDALPATPISVNIPDSDSKYDGLAITGEMCGVAIIRSGECMEEALRSVWRDVKVGKLFLRRQGISGLVPVYLNLPADIQDRYVLLLDPMLATGASFICAARVLIAQGVQPSKILCVSMLASPEGIAAVLETFPEITVCTGEIDETVSAEGLILPGIGVFGDRYFGIHDNDELATSGKW